MIVSSNDHEHKVIIDQPPYMGKHQDYTHARHVHGIRWHFGHEEATCKHWISTCKMTKANKHTICIQITAHASSKHIFGKTAKYNRLQ